MYESLQTDLSASLARLLRAAGAEFRGVSATNKLVKITPEDLRESVLNFDAILRVLSADGAPPCLARYPRAAAARRGRLRACAPPAPHPR